MEGTVAGRKTWVTGRLEGITGLAGTGNNTESRLTRAETVSGGGGISGGREVSSGVDFSGDGDGHRWETPGRRATRGDNRPSSDQRPARTKVAEGGYDLR